MILGSHSKIYCYDEQLAYKRLRDSDASEASGRDWIGCKIPRWTVRLNNPVLSDEGHDVVANRFYASEPIIFLIRDVRDVVASMICLKFPSEHGDVSWLESWGLRILPAKGRDLEFGQRYRWELDWAKKDEYAVRVLYWKFKTEAYLDYSS